VFVDPAHLTGWEWEYVILQTEAGTILILGTQMLPNLHQYSHDRISQLQLNYCLLLLITWLLITWHCG